MIKQERGEGGQHLWLHDQDDQLKRLKEKGRCDQRTEL